MGVYSISVPLRLAVGASILALAAAAHAVPTLQVGVPDGFGGYLAYTSNSTDPTEEDTAITSGNQLAVGGAYGPNDLLIGGKYSLSSPDYSSFGLPVNFNNHGAVLMATTSDNSGSLTVNALNPFYSTPTLLFPNNHAPLQEPGVQYLFFDIGNFLSTGTVPDFADSSQGSANGEVKLLSFATSGFDWIHFDVMALVTTERGPRLVSTLDRNPGSHDVTWKPDGEGPPQGVPEPASLALVGLGLVGIRLTRQRKGQNGPTA